MRRSVRNTARVNFRNPYGAVVVNVICQQWLHSICSRISAVTVGRLSLNNWQLPANILHLSTIIITIPQRPAHTQFISSDTTNLCKTFESETNKSILNRQRLSSVPRIREFKFHGSPAFQCSLNMEKQTQSSRKWPKLTRPLCFTDFTCAS